MGSQKNQKRTFVTSTLITIFIVVMLIISGPAQAVSVIISGLQTTPYAQGSRVNFQVQIKINDPDQFVPITNISLNVTGPTNKARTFLLDGTPIAGDAIINITGVSIPPSADFGYGYGYGYDAGTGHGYNFGYGYGYGYGYGTGGGQLTYIYNVTISTASLPAGNYNVVASLNTGEANKPSFKSAQKSFTITTSPPSGGGGGSGGGINGGVVSSEPLGNIEKCGNKQGESNERHLVANTPATYSFTPCEGGIYEIVVIGQESEDADIRVEHLHGLSQALTRPTQPAPEEVYYYVNIWSGTKKIKEAIIRFKVENSWLAEKNIKDSDVRMLKWKDGNWALLETTEIRKDATHTFFEAKTDGFSHFAVRGESAVTTPISTPEPMTLTPTPPSTPTPPISPPTSLAWILYVVVGLMIAAAVYFLVIRKK